MRIGHGYDAHRFGENRRLIIGGVEIPYEKGMVAHSDGDVLIHAVMDSILGACGEKDIGSCFPDSSDEFKDIDSRELLRRVAKIVSEHGYSVDYVDATVIAQAPKMKPHISSMRDEISAALGIDVSRVNVKATTEEYMGFTGRKEGIAAHAVCIIKE